MTVVAQVHQTLANTTWIFFLIIGLWALYRAVRGYGVDSSFLGAMIIGELLFVVEGALGLTLWIGGRGGEVSRLGIHVLYGVFAVVFLPFLFTYQRGDDSNRAQWVYAFGLLFLFGIALRSITTAV